MVAGGGADAVNIREIARQAGVHDSSIYRRWPMHFRLLLTRLPIDDNITGQLVDFLVNGLAR
jgi:hypothetical protein